MTAGATRVLDATPNAHDLGIEPASPVSIDLLVSDAAGNQIPAEQYQTLLGFRPTFAWDYEPPPGGQQPATG